MSRTLFKATSALALAAHLFLAQAVLAGDRSVKIEFLPPPMQGTVSLGIYDAEGKLVRTLAREAEVSEFTAALNGLITKWDGNDDAGKPCPAGKYHARGYMVGEMEIKGVDYLGNDWFTSEDSPRVRRIADLTTNPDGKLLVSGNLVGESVPKWFNVEPLTEDAELKPALADLKPVKTVVLFPGGKVNGTEASVSAPVDASPGTNGSTWVIDGRDIKQVSAKGELLHRFSPDPEDAPPAKVVALTNKEIVAVLGQTGSAQEMHVLDFTGVSSDGAPKELLERDIQFSELFSAVASTLTFSDDKPFVPAAALKVNLVPNPLLKGKLGSAELVVKVDSKGSYFALTDGLPICQISDVPHLLWAVAGREPGTKVITVFESDGAVIGEYSAARLANMMAFDAGEFELQTPEASPTPSSSQDGEQPGQVPADSAVPSPSVSPGVVTGTIPEVVSPQ